MQTFTFDGEPDSVALETVWFEDLGDGTTRLHAQSLIDSFEGRDESGRLRKGFYRAELSHMQGELVKLQYWIQQQGLKVLVIFEGRGSAGKGGVIKRITERTSPRIVRIEALPRPTERERSQWYLQRYVELLPAAGEMELFDRSWYNRSNTPTSNGRRGTSCPPTTSGLPDSTASGTSSTSSSTPT